MLQHGSIVWVELVDPHGRNRKCRPAVVVSPSPQAEPEHIVAVAVTSTFSIPRPDNTVSLPWDASGNCRSGLKRECVAICDWLVVFPIVAVKQVVGICDRNTLAQIMSRLPSPPPEDA